MTPPLPSPWPQDREPAGAACPLPGLGVRLFPLVTLWPQGGPWALAPQVQSCECATPNPKKPQHGHQAREGANLIHDFCILGTGVDQGHRGGERGSPNCSHLVHRKERTPPLPLRLACDPEQEEKVTLSS